MKRKNLLCMVILGPENEKYGPVILLLQISLRIRCISLPVGVTAGIKHSLFLENSVP